MPAFNIEETEEWPVFRLEKPHLNSKEKVYNCTEEFVREYSAAITLYNHVQNKLRKMVGYDK
jgi:hypothetical protein